MSAIRRRKPPRVGDRPATRYTLLAFVLVVSALLIVAPLVVIFVQAFSAGLDAYAAAIGHPDTLHAIFLTVVTALIAVPINTAFGVAAAWAITKFNFWGRRFLLVVIEIPFSISPIVAGVAPAARTSASLASPTSMPAGAGKPWATSVVSRATTGRSSKSAAWTSSATRIRCCTRAA